MLLASVGQRSAWTGTWMALGRGAGFLTGRTTFLGFGLGLGGRGLGSGSTDVGAGEATAGWGCGTGGLTKLIIIGLGARNGSGGCGRYWRRPAKSPACRPMTMSRLRTERPVATIHG
jgi:hypothetical protein